MTPARRTRRGHGERGVTVLELIVVVGILGLLGALAVGALDRAIAAARTSGAVRTLRDDLELARARAMAQGTYWGICLRGPHYTGSDGAPNEMTLFAKPTPNLAPDTNNLQPANAQLNRVDDPSLPRDRVGDRRIIAGASGEALELGEGVAADGVTTIMFDLMGRPWVFQGDTCDSTSLTVVAGQPPSTVAWPGDPVHFQIRIPLRTDSEETGRRLVLNQNASLEIPDTWPP